VLDLGCTGQYSASGTYATASDGNYSVAFAPLEVYYDGNSDANSTRCHGSSPLVNMELKGTVSADSLNFGGFIPTPGAGIYVNCESARLFNTGGNCYDPSTKTLPQKGAPGADECLGSDLQAALPYGICDDCLEDTAFAFIGTFHMSRDPANAKAMLPSGTAALPQPSCSGPTAVANFAITTKPAPAAAADHVPALAASGAALVLVAIAGAVFRMRNRQASLGTTVAAETEMQQNPGVNELPVTVDDASAL
jgi:hypothetical protein